MTLNAPNLDDLGVDLKLQENFRKVIEEISSNVRVALLHIDDWDTTVDFIPVAPELFVEELGEAYPIFSVDVESLKMSFISRNDGKYWQFSVSKTSFLEILDDPQSPSSESAEWSELSPHELISGLPGGFKRVTS